MRAFLSILGLYNYDDSIFADFNVPQGMDKDVAIKKILFECAELGLVYTEPDTVKSLIKNWTETHMDNWNRMYEAFTEEYNPIHNYDKHEEWTDEFDGTAGTDGTSERDVAGFNDNTQLVNESKITNSEESTAANTNDHTGHIYGNIGVTTSQQMLEAEMELRSTYNMYKIISDSFKYNFCIMVY